MGIFGRDEPDPGQRPAQPNPKSAAAPQREGSADRTVVARPSAVEGRISGSCEIVISGQVKGTIDGTGKVTIAEQGKVEATTHGRIVIVGGTIKGDITADERIELESSARVDGNITAPRILIKDGATFKGQVNMKDPGRRPQMSTSSARKDVLTGLRSIPRIAVVGERKLFLFAG